MVRTRKRVAFDEPELSHLERPPKKPRLDSGAISSSASGSTGGPHNARNAALHVSPAAPAPAPAPAASHQSTKRSRQVLEEEDGLAEDDDPSHSFRPSERLRVVKEEEEDGHRHLKQVDSDGVCIWCNSTGCDCCGCELCISDIEYDRTVPGPEPYSFLGPEFDRPTLMSEEKMSRLLADVRRFYERNPNPVTDEQRARKRQEDYKQRRLAEEQRRRMSPSRSPSEAPSEILPAALFIEDDDLERIEDVFGQGYARRWAEHLERMKEAEQVRRLEAWHAIPADGSCPFRGGPGSQSGTTVENTPDPRNLVVEQQQCLDLERQRLDLEQQRLDLEQQRLDLEQQQQLLLQQPEQKQQSEQNQQPKQQQQQSPASSRRPRRAGTTPAPPTTRRANRVTKKSKASGQRKPAPKQPKKEPKQTPKSGGGGSRRVPGQSHPSKNAAGQDGDELVGGPQRRLTRQQRDAESFYELDSRGKPRRI